MRARNIKPDYYRDAELDECSIPARWIFPALWMMADREGRLKDNPKQIKREICPLDKLNVDKLLGELVKAGVITRYTIEGKKYIQVNNFKKHQNPHRNEPDSTIPEPVETLPEGSSNDASAPADSYILNPDSLIPENNMPDKSGGFDLFWKSYPKKKSKGQAEKAWKRINPNEQLQNEILESLERAKKSGDWIKDGGQFVPYPATWLNAKGWLDEYDTIPKPGVDPYEGLDD